VLTRGRPNGRRLRPIPSLGTSETGLAGSPNAERRQYTQPESLPGFKKRASQDGRRFFSQFRKIRGLPAGHSAGDSLSELAKPLADTEHRQAKNRTKRALFHD
jgi:hypothetical protein